MWPGKQANASPICCKGFPASASRGLRPGTSGPDGVGDGALPPASPSPHHLMHRRIALCFVASRMLTVNLCRALGLTGPPPRHRRPLHGGRFEPHVSGGLFGRRAGRAIGTVVSAQPITTQVHSSSIQSKNCLMLRMGPNALSMKSMNEEQWKGIPCNGPVPSPRPKVQTWVCFPTTPLGCKVRLNGAHWILNTTVLTGNSWWKELFYYGTFTFYTFLN